MKVILDMNDQLDPLDNRVDVLEVVPPPGYRRVWVGAVKPGDLYLDVGMQTWEPAATAILSRYATANLFDCLIRCDGGEDPIGTCERCQAEPKRTGYRYCADCCRVIVEGQAADFEATVKRRGRPRKAD